MSQSNPKVAVVILNWNGKRFLKQFLPSVSASIYSNLEIIVADNDSTDDSIEFLKETYPQVKIIQNETNEGFAKGYNTALKQVDSDYYVLLNSDVEVPQNWIQPVIDLLERDEKNAAATPHVLDQGNKSKFEYAGAAGGYIDKYGFPFCRGRIFDQIEDNNEQYKDSKEVFWASGAALFIKAELYHEIGGLDEELFAHMEEIDLCWRLQNKGYKIFNCADAEVYHVGGGTLNQASSFKTYLNFRNNLVIMMKNLASEDYNYIIRTRILLDYIAAAKFLLSFNFSFFWAVLKAHAFILTNRTEIKKKRINPPSNSSHLKGFYNNSIVVDFFLKGKKKYSDLSL